MELFAEILSVVGALLLSVSCGVLVEELLFGGLVRLFFPRRPATLGNKKQNQRNEEGERPCLP
ncbi:MAG: hypothetical protein WCC14_12805 [Acidobacteriaceae bacterium]